MVTTLESHFMGAPEKSKPKNQQMEDPKEIELYDGRSLQF
jgi:hypothetical protein